MSAELEQRLRDAFRRLPGPARDASNRARSVALSALPAEERRSRGWIVLVAVAVAAALGIGAAALAATGNLHVELGAKSPAPTAGPSRLALPPGTNGIAIVAGGKLWLATRRGLRIDALPANAAELSPRALYAAVGIGNTLMAVAPGGRHPWIQVTDGRVGAIAWSPDGLKIAYVVRRRRVGELHLIEGDGDHDRVVAAGVTPAKPSWRADSLAVAYVQANGRVGVFDLGIATNRSFDTRRCGGAARAVAYAPNAPRLAVAGANGVAIVGRWNVRPSCLASFDSRRVLDSIAWLRSRRIVTIDNPGPGVRGQSTMTTLVAPEGGRRRRNASFPAGARIATASAARASLAIAIRRAPRVVEVARVAAPADGPRATPLRALQPVLQLRVPPSRVSISWR